MFGLQEYAVYCFSPIALCKCFHNCMAISPEDAYRQSKTMGLEPISWVTENEYGEY